VNHLDPRDALQEIPLTAAGKNKSGQDKEMGEPPHERRLLAARGTNKPISDGLSFSSGFERSISSFNDKCISGQGTWRPPVRERCAIQRQRMTSSR
jgi:hypothetical protein